MNNGTVCAIAFSVGAAVGSIVTWQLLKTKYERIAQEEIESVKEVFSKRAATAPSNDDIGDSLEIPELQDDTKQYLDYESIVTDNGYINYNDIQKPEKGGAEITDKPYVIAPEEYDTIEGYETVELTYYADEILTDEMDDIIEDVDATVGEDSLHHFGEYEDDSVYVRDDLLKIDYAILKDTRRYDEVFSVNRYPADE